MMVTVALADEIDLALVGAQTALQQDPDVRITATFQALPDLLAHLTTTPPDMLLLSDRLEPDLNALALVERVHIVAPQTCIIILSHAYDGLVVHELFACGASGYLYRGDPLSEDILRAIWTVRRGRLYLSPTANAEYLLAMQSDRASWQLDAEAREILRQMAQGYRPQEIALMRNVPVRRIYWVNNKLRNRFGAETNEQLMVLAAEEGFLA
jgi:DNA-binding NarL/FixJ family response regulator